jgi:hypothetical protein
MLLATPTGVDAHMLPQIVMAAEGLVTARVGALEGYSQDCEHRTRGNVKESVLTLFVGMNTPHMSLEVLAASEAFATTVDVTHVSALWLRDAILCSGSTQRRVMFESAEIIPS